jgi:hypothetical protein
MGKREFERRTGIGIAGKKGKGIRE